MHKGYFGDTNEQIHFRQLGKGGTPLLCLPPAPHTGAYFETVMPFLGKHKKIISVDYPGYGRSDRLKGSPSIEAYAKRIILNFKKVDLLGFHTGNLVALEMARLHPNCVQKIIMIDVPFFDQETRKVYKSKLSPNVLPKGVEEDYDMAVIKRHSSISQSRAHTLWLEKLQSGAHQNDAFHAAFDYDCQGQFSKLTRPVNIIATQSGLLEPSRKAAKVLPNAMLVERLDITAPVFEAHAEAISDAILNHI